VRLSPIALTRLAVVAAAAALFAPSLASAQRRPGVGMGFYTYTGLVTGEVEIGQVSGTTAYAEGPKVTLSGMFTMPLAKLRKKAIILGLRGTAVSYGNSDGCYIVAPSTECRNRRFTERVTLLPGMSFDIRTVLVRFMAGPTLYSVEKEGSRVGTQVRMDFTRPGIGSTMPTAFVSRSFMGSQFGREAGFTTLGIGLRKANKK
jgi:hypothetical protein